MRLLKTFTLGILLSMGMISLASAHCGGCGVGDKKEKKAHKHDHKDGKHEQKKEQAEEKACDSQKSETPTGKASDKSPETPAKVNTEKAIDTATDKK